MAAQTEVIRLTDYKPNEFSKFIQDFRAERDISQGEMAEQYDLVKSHIGFVETGRYEFPFSMISKLWKYMTKTEKARARELIDSLITDKLEKGEALK